MNAPVVYGPNGQALPAGIGKAVAQLASGGVEVGYRPKTNREQALDGWAVSQTSADGGWLAQRDRMVAYARELYATEPWAQGGIDRKLDMVVGAGWRPSIRPDAAALGIDDQAAAELGRAIERAWQIWADDTLCRCDFEETLSGSWLLHLMVLEHEVTGDGLGVIRYAPRADWGFGTQLHVIDSDRLSTPVSDLGNPRISGGVETDVRGVPVAYHVRNAHPGERVLGRVADAFTWTRIPRRETYGRPKVLHLYRKDRPGQSRGVSRLVAGLARFKQLQRFADSELSNAVINALFAATITSSFDPATVQDNLTAPAIAGMHELRNGFYDTSSPTLGGARVQHLFPGDELKFNASPRSTAAFEPFAVVFLRSLASGLGITYEQIAMDWSKVNYSSARAALVEVWRGIMKARSLVEIMVARPLLLAVTEDAIDQGLIEAPPAAPDLYDAPAAWLRGRWIGPARGWVDPVKEPQGAFMKISAGVSNWEDEVAEQGGDFEQNLDALARQRDMWTERKLIPPVLADMLAVTAPTDQQPPARGDEA